MRGNFPSKDDLILDFLRRREQQWTREWLKADSQRRGESPQEQPLAIFDVFSEWFSQRDFDGCSLRTTMIEVNDPRITRSISRWSATWRISATTSAGFLGRRA